MTGRCHFNLCKYHQHYAQILQLTQEDTLVGGVPFLAESIDNSNGIAVTELFQGLNVGTSSLVYC